MTHAHRLLPGLLLSLATLAPLSADDQAAPAPGETPPLATPAQLLELAFDAASAMPHQPHIKNRSRAQEQVVATCLELGDTDLALTYIEGIDNWRRGAALADYAWTRARQGAGLAEIQPFLDRAGEIAEELDTEEAQAWRRDRIRAKIARALHAVGQDARAASFETALEDSESGWLVVSRARSAQAEQLDGYLDEARQAAASGTYDQVRNALSTCAQLYGRLYADEEARAALQEAIEASWTGVPVQIRIELLMELARFALDHDDPVQAAALVHQARALLDAQRWLPEHHVPLAARLAALRFATGEVEAARAEIEAERRLYEAESALIVDIFRAETLIPLAESYAAMDEPAMALDVWSRAVDEALHNPNSRPRAEDLAAICCSLAASGMTPDADLSRRLRDARETLGAPW